MNLDAVRKMAFGGDNASNEGRGKGGICKNFPTSYLIFMYIYRNELF